MTTSLAIVADFNPNSPSHAATNDAIQHSASQLGLALQPTWVGTSELTSPKSLAQLRDFGGIWIGPGSPYASMDGALAAIRFARDGGIPLLGTCGGFQHIILEFARNMLGFKDAEHEESAPEASLVFISRLVCSLAGRTMTITLDPNSRLAAIYGRTTVQEQYLCNFGVNPSCVDPLRSGPLKPVASDPEGVIRAVELPTHPFFIGTLFLPQHRSTPSIPHPLVSAFIQAACAQR